MATKKRPTREDIPAMLAEYVTLEARQKADAARMAEIKEHLKAGKRTGEFEFSHGDDTFIVKRWDQVGGVNEAVLTTEFPPDKFPNLYNDQIDATGATFLLPKKDYPHIYTSVPDKDAIRNDLPKDAQDKVLRKTAYVKVIVKPRKPEVQG